MLGYDTSHVAKKYDVAVIGAGVFGAWTAFHLVRRGARVLIVDQHAPANSRASSGGETRVIRMSYGADEIYTRSSMRSLELWRQFFPSMFHRTGVLVTSGVGDPYLAATRETLTRAGYEFEWLGYSMLRKRFPNIRFDRGAAAVYEPGSGVLMARRAVQAVVDAAVQAGARYETRRLIDPDRKLAERFAFACGPWLPKIFPKVIGARIRPTRQEVFFYGTPPEDRRFAEMPVWIAFREGAYTLPSLDGRGFKLAIDEHGPAFDPETGDRSASPKTMIQARELLKKRFPDLAGAPLLETRVCQYENTSNGDFLIDRHPELDNVWLVGGGSGHGFKHGPFVGEYVAGQVLGGGIAEPRFSLASKGLRKNRTVY
jgi:sarcosine oxidase